VDWFGIPFVKSTIKFGNRRQGVQIVTPAAMPVRDCDFLNGMEKVIDSNPSGSTKFLYQVSSSNFLPLTFSLTRFPPICFFSNVGCYIGALVPIS